MICIWESTDCRVICVWDSTDGMMICVWESTDCRVICVWVNTDRRVICVWESTDSRIICVWESTDSRVICVWENTDRRVICVWESTDSRMVCVGEYRLQDDLSIRSTDYGVICVKRICTKASRPQTVNIFFLRFIITLHMLAAILCRSQPVLKYNFAMKLTAVDRLPS
jgi:hypothetical protein